MIKETKENITFTETKELLTLEQCYCNVCKKLIYEREIDTERSDSRFPKYNKKTHICKTYKVEVYLDEDDCYPNELHACSDECLATLFLNWCEDDAKKREGTIISVTSENFH